MVNCNHIVIKMFTCRSPSAGKLIHFVVDDGGHVFQGESYAEIEVSVTSISSAVSKCVYYLLSFVLFFHLHC